jgi:hypothetical protein
LSRRTGARRTEDLRWKTPYAPDGRLAQTQLGNSLYETRDYGTPGMPTSYMLGTSAGGSQRLRLEYHFDATHNGGNPISSWDHQWQQ